MSFSITGRTTPPMNAAVYRSGVQPSLTRYGSAPGSLLAKVADSIGSDGQMSRFFPRESPPCLASDSDCKVSGAVALDGGCTENAGLQQPFDLGGDALARNLVSDQARAGVSHLMRQHSSPAGFFSHLMIDTGFSATRGTRNYFQPVNEGTNALTGRRLKSQLSFSTQDTVSQISEISIPGMGESSDEAGGNVGQSFMPRTYPIRSWDETNSIVFSTKRSRDSNGDIISTLNNIDSQYGHPGTSVDMSTVDKLLQIQQDSVPFKIRAKRGCATHPRSIAERERRTRISEKLRKLQEIVPNMDKQTSTADMLDLAVQHIKGLQSQIQQIEGMVLLPNLFIRIILGFSGQILKQEQASCICAFNDENS